MVELQFYIELSTLNVLVQSLSICISIGNGRNKHFILCVYLKSESGNHEDNKVIYQGQLEELKYFFDDLDTTSVSIFGDWNADLVKIKI